jgi:hypothetical protein
MCVLLQQYAHLVAYEVHQGQDAEELAKYVCPRTHAGHAIPDTTASQHVQDTKWQGGDNLQANGLRDFVDGMH